MSRKKLSTSKSSADGLRLVELLQNFIVEQNEVIENLQAEMSQLRSDKDKIEFELLQMVDENCHLKKQLKTRGLSTSSESCVPTVRSELKRYDSSSSDTGPNSPSQVTITVAPKIRLKSSSSNMLSKNDSPDTETEPGNSECTTEVFFSNLSSTETCTDSSPTRHLDSSVESTPRRDSTDSKSPQHKRVVRTPSYRLRHPESKRKTEKYELSADLKARTVEVLEKKYGGKDVANKAAKIIQLYYRHWMLSKSFKRMRAYSEKRKKSYSALPEQHFHALMGKAGATVYNLENPVMIIDVQSFETALPDTTVNEKATAFAITCKSSVSSRDSESDDQVSTPDEKKEIPLPEFARLDSFAETMPADVDMLSESHSSSLPIDTQDIQPTISGQTSDDNESHTTEKTESDEFSYEIIDENHVMQVLGRRKDDADGSNYSLDRINESDTDTPDVPGEEFFPDSDEYKPTVDKYMHKRQFRIGINLFNRKPEMGLQYILDNGLLEDDPTKIAKFLRKETTIAKQKISEYFGNIRKEFNMKILDQFAASFDFAGKEIDEALRQFQSYFKLTGEAQTVEKFLQVFSERYAKCNPGKISNNPDVILLLAFAMAMLNTDLHNQNVKRKMAVEDFIRNLRGTDDGNDLPEDLLRSIYGRIQKNEFATGADHTTQLAQIEHSFIGKCPSLSVPYRQFVKLFQIEEVYDPNRKERPHLRLAFLFNDMILLTKPRGSAGPGSGHIYSYKSSYSLLGTKITPYSSEHYPFGALLMGKVDQKMIACFHLKDDKSRKAFIDEVDEYIRETNGLENIRIALSKANQINSTKGYRKQSRNSKLSKNSKDRKNRNSLSDFNVGTSLEAEDLSSVKGRSTSMTNISEPYSDSESDPGLRRTNSSTSLDVAYLTTNSNHSTKPHSETLGHGNRLLSTKKSIFSFGSRRRKVSSSTGSLDRKHTSSLSKFFAEENTVLETESQA